MNPAVTSDAVDKMALACFGNMTFLVTTLLVRGYNILQSASYSSCNALEFILLASGVLFNYFLLSYRTDQASSNTILTSLLQKIQEIKESQEQRTMTQWLQACVDGAAGHFQFLVNSMKPHLPPVQQTNIDIVQIPALVDKIMKSPPSEDVDSMSDQPTRSCPSVSSDDTAKSEKSYLSIKSRIPPTKSPELFKNKMYLTRQKILDSLRTPKTGK